MIAKSEYIVVTHFNDGEIVSVITSKYPETTYYFYERVNDDYTKLGKAESPTELEKKYGIKQRMGIEEG